MNWGSALQAAGRHPVGVLSKRLGIVLLLYFVSRLLFFMFHASEFTSAGAGGILASFLYGVRFDFAAIVITNALFILLHLAPLGVFDERPYQITLKVLFYVVNLPALIVNCIDLAYFKYTLKRMTSDVIYLMQLPEHNLIPRLVADFWFLVLLGVGLIVLAEWLYRKTKRESWDAPVKKKLINQAALLVPMVALFVILGRGGVQLKPIMIINASHMGRPETASLILNTPFCLLQTVGRAELKEMNYMPPDEAERVFPIVHQRAETEEFRKLNVVFIILESFGSEYVGALNGGNGYTPFFDRMLRNSLVYANGFANGKRSMDGIPAILSGLPSLMNSPYITSAYSGSAINSIASLLKPLGYHTSFYHGGENGTMGFDSYSRMAGFTHYYGLNEYNNMKHWDGFWGIYDEEFLQYFAQGLNKTPEPFVSVCFTLSSHHPYNIPPSYKSMFRSGTLPIHPSIQYTDWSLQRFFDTASTMPWFRNTLFVLVADHTAQAEGAYYKNRVGMYAIPIVFYRPDGELQGIRREVAQQTDILPTVLDYLNYPGKYVSFGSSLFDPAAPRCALSYLSGLYQIVGDEYCLHFDGRETIGVYRYRDDATLSTNLVEEGLPVAAELQRRLQAAIQQHHYGLIHNKLRPK